jgi:hypothetical protein
MGLSCGAGAELRSIMEDGGLRPDPSEPDCGAAQNLVAKPESSRHSRGVFRVAAPGQSDSNDEMLPLELLKVASTSGKE